MTGAVRTALRGLAEGRPALGDHAGLILDYLVPAVVDEPPRRDSQDPLGAGYERVCAIAPSPLYAAAYARWTARLDQAPGAETGEYRVRNRLIVGLGAATVREAGVRLMRAYGVPFIPGSALKGLAGRYAEREAGLSPETRAVLFGGRDSAAYVTWLDAWYVPGSAPENRPLARDVITVHHPRYYGNRGDKGAPWDFDDPTPVPFLSARGVYLVAVRGPDPTWAALGLALLERALDDWGVGAKTSGGYGRLEPVGARRATVGRAASGGTAAAPPLGAPKPAGATEGAESLPKQSVGLDAESGAPPEGEAGRPMAPAQPSAGTSLAQAVHGLTVDDALTDHLHGYYQRWRALGEGSDRLDSARALAAKLKEAGLLDRPKWLKKPWVQELITYLNRQRRAGL